MTTTFAGSATRIRFTVTQEHIAAADADDDAAEGTAAFLSVKCPIERALGPGWVVDDAEARYGDDGPSFRLSDEAQAFVAEFDSRHPVAPFTGEVYR